MIKRVGALMLLSAVLLVPAGVSYAGKKSVPVSGTCLCKTAANNYVSAGPPPSYPIPATNLCKLVAVGADQTFSLTDVSIAGDPFSDVTIQIFDGNGDFTSLRETYTASASSLTQSTVSQSFQTPVVFSGDVLMTCFVVQPNGASLSGATVSGLLK